MSTREERRQALLDQIARAHDELARLGYDVEEPPRRPPNRGGTGRPLRTLVLDVLEELGFPAFSREVLLYVAAMYGERVDPSRFGALRQQEKKAFVGPRARSVYISYGLTQKGEAIKRLLARSDWPLAARVVAPTTGRAQHLRITKRLCEIAMDRRDRAYDFDALQLLIADHARDLPGVKFRRGDFPINDWHALASDLLDEIDERDRENREVIARRLSLLNPVDQVFGTEKAVEPEPRLRTPITEESLGA